MTIKLRRVRETQEGKAVVSVAEPDVQHGAGQVVGRARRSAAADLVRRAVSPSLVRPFLVEQPIDRLLINTRMASWQPSNTAFIRCSVRGFASARAAGAPARRD